MRPEIVDELISANDNRQAVYSFLAGMYAVEISKETLKDLAEKRNLWFRLAEDSGARGTEIAEGFKSLAEFAATLKESEMDKVLLELAAEYAGLFLGVRQVPPHPSESVYTGEDKLIMQKARDEVLMIYRGMGLEKTKEFNEPEDHIALELRFMAYMCGKTSEALKNDSNAEAKKYLEVQRDFLIEHLAKWVPMLVADILKGARREFYKAVAKITRGYVQMDREIIIEMIDGILPILGSKASKEP
jgi:TorA maturation chaperone TorD